MAGTLLIYVHDLRVSGVVKNALAIARRLSRDRPVVLCAGPGPMPDPAPDIGLAQLIVLPLPDDGIVTKKSAAPALREAIVQTGAVAVMSAGNLGHRAVRRACRGLAIPTIYRISNAVKRPTGWRLNLKRHWQHRKLIKSAALVILVGQSFRRSLTYVVALALGKAVEIPNGVDVDHARRLAAGPSPHPWMDDPVPVVLAIGRIHPQKNFPLLVTASANAMGRAPHRLVLLGHGPEYEVEKLMEQARSLGIADRVLMPGSVDNVFAWLGRAKLFALVSRWEGSSNALLEAMAVGTPVLVSRTAGDAAAVLAGRRYGRLVNGDDEDAVADGIVAQLRHPIFPNNRVERYRLDTVLDRYAKVLNAF